MVCCCKGYCTSLCLSTCKHCSICKPWRSCYSCKKCCSCSCYENSNSSDRMHCQEQDAKRTWNRRRDLPRGECRGCMDTKRAIIKVERKEKWPRFSPDDAEERHKCSPCAANTAMLEKKVSRELRSSILYTVCECGKRNGLQDDCRKSLCQGRSSCLKKPEPECLPARYYRRKNDVLERKIGDGSGIKRESHEYSRPSTPKKVKFEEVPKKSMKSLMDRCYEVQEVNCKEIAAQMGGAPRMNKIKK